MATAMPSRIDLQALPLALQAQARSVDSRQDRLIVGSPQAVEERAHDDAERAAARASPQRFGPRGVTVRPRRVPQGQPRGHDGPDPWETSSDSLDVAERFSAFGDGSEAARFALAPRWTRNRLALYHGELVARLVSPPPRATIGWPRSEAAGTAPCPGGAPDVRSRAPTATRQDEPPAPSGASPQERLQALHARAMQMPDSTAVMMDTVLAQPGMGRADLLADVVRLGRLSAAESARAEAMVDPVRLHDAGRALQGARGLMSVIEGFESGWRGTLAGSGDPPRAALARGIASAVSGPFSVEHAQALRGLAREAHQGDAPGALIDAGAADERLRRALHAIDARHWSHGIAAKTAYLSAYLAPERSPGADRWRDALRRSLPQVLESTHAG